MESADLITSFFNNEMNPDQERQFLVSVASSDSLRLGLKSHVMLDRVLAEQAQHTNVPESVRDSILVEARAAVTGGSAPASGPGSTAGKASLGEGFTRRAGVMMVALVMAFGSFFAGYFVRPALESDGATRALSPVETEGAEFREMEAMPRAGSELEGPESVREGVTYGNERAVPNGAGDIKETVPASGVNSDGNFRAAGAGNGGDNMRSGTPDASNVLPAEPSTQGDREGTPDRQSIDGTSRQNNGQSRVPSASVGTLKVVTPPDNRVDTGDMTSNPTDREN